MHLRILQLVAALCVVGVGQAAAQELASAEDRPRFLVVAVAGKPPVAVDASRVPVLRRRVTAAIDGVPLGDALKEVGRQAGVRFALSRESVPVERRVSLHATDITFGAALFELLSGLGLDVQFSGDNRSAAIMPRPAADPEPQVGTIAGRVTDASDNLPVAGAEVRVVGTQLGALVNDSGQYVLRNVPPGEQRVMARRIGYQAQTRTVAVPDGGTATLDFALSVVATQLDELVKTVTGDQRRLEVGHTVASIQADSLMQSAPVMSFGDLVQGRAPGVLSMTTGPNVGQAGTIRLRGLNSFGVSNDPIVVVDGVRIEATSGTWLLAAATSPTAGGFTGRLADLDPDEIASVEVVKGPSAATLYGTDAANGVLVITTKRGQAGRARWTAFSEQGILAQRLDQWDDAYYAFGHSTTTGVSQRCVLQQRAAGSCVLDSLVSFNTFTNPETRPFKNGRREQYGLQVSGGTAGGATYFLSGGYEHETGTYNMPLGDQAFLQTQRGAAELPDWQLRPNAYAKVNLRANLTAPLGRRGSVTLATGFVSNQARQPVLNPRFGQVGYRDVNDGWFVGGRPATLYAMRAEDVVRRFVGSVATSYRVGEWLTLRGTAGADLSTDAFGQLLRRGEAAPGSFFLSGRREANELNIARYSLDLGATATHALSSALSSKTSVGVQYNRRAQRGTQIIATNLPLGSETVAGAANPLVASEATLTTAVAGGYVEEVLGLRDRLFLTGAVRFDGGSAFGKDFSVAVYPKASVSWVVTDGQAGPRLPGVSTLRLRAAYGASGVQPGPTAALQQFQPIAGVSGTTAAPGVVLGAFGNAGLKPERTSELEAGLDLELAGGRVRLEFTGYQRTSHDALVNRPVAPQAGGGTRWENLGSVRNRGLELLLSADVLRGRWLSAGVTLTGSVNENRLLSLGEGVVVSAPSAPLWRQDVGYPLQGLWGRTVASYADANGNGIIEPTEFTLSDNLYHGPQFPPREATAAPYLGLFGERLRLSGLFQYRGGFYTFNTALADACLSSRSCRALNDASVSLADQAAALAMAQNFAYGTMIEPASYLFLRELSASLTLPAGWGRVVGAREARLVLAARNVALLWRQGRNTAPENDVVSSDQTFPRTGGPPTYLLVRLNLNY